MHLYRTTAPAAEFLVAEGRAEIAQANGRVRAVKLVETAQTHAQRIGEASAPAYGTKFVVREKLYSGHVVWRHRCIYD